MITNLRMELFQALIHITITGIISITASLHHSLVSSYHLHHQCTVSPPSPAGHMAATCSHLTGVNYPPAVAGINICILTFALSSKLVHNTPIHPLRFLATRTTWHSPQICCGCDQKKLQTMRGRVDRVATVARWPVITMMHLTCASHAPMIP